MKCKWFDLKSGGCTNPEYDRKNFGKQKYCPANTTDNCNIKKCKDKIVKAWAYFSYGQIEIQRHNCIQPSVPVIIHFKTADWDKIKGEL